MSHHLMTPIHPHTVMESRTTPNLPATDAPPRGWFDTGSAMFARASVNPRDYPPLHDMQAQRWWLGGFLAAWGEWLERRGFDLLDPPPNATLGARLARVLEDRPELLRQLLALGNGRMSRHAH